MMTEAKYIDGILDREGRTYTNRAADRGGPTKFGITQATLSRWRKAPATAADVEALQEPEARAIYAAWYLAPWAWVPDERLRVLLTDWFVTTSPQAVVRALQLAVRAVPDGVLGDETRRLAVTAVAADQGRVYAAVLSARMRYYTDLALNDAPLKAFVAAHDDLQVRNLRGWLNRCAEFI